MTHIEQQLRETLKIPSKSGHVGDVEIDKSKGRFKSNARAELRM